MIQMDINLFSVLLVYCMPYCNAKKALCPLSLHLLKSGFHPLSSRVLKKIAGMFYSNVRKQSHAAVLFFFA